MGVSVRSAAGDGAGDAWSVGCIPAAVLERLEEVPRPFRKLDYEKALARAWVAAGQGAVSEAIGVLEVGSRDGGSERTIRG